MPPPNRPRLCLCLAALGLAAASAAQAVSVASRFDSGTEGWLAANITALPGVGAATDWDSANQRITTLDQVTWNTFSAPAAWLGNRLAYYGGTLSFDLMDDRKDANADTVATFGIASGATTLFWFGGSPSTTAMTTFTASLNETDTRWRIGGSPLDFTSGTAPTPAQFQTVLSGLTMLRINADWATAYPDTATLDNVVLQSAVPEPGPATLCAAGLAGLGGLAWRRRAAR